jgi:hypothetical protein
MTVVIDMTANRLRGAARIEADRMWRGDRTEFEKEEGFAPGDALSVEYQVLFCDWALARMIKQGRLFLDPRTGRVDWTSFK